MNNTAHKTRIVAVLSGDIQRDPIANSKYGYLLEILSRQFSLTHIYDAKIPNWARLINALLSIHPDKPLWREAFRKNKFAFKVRSQRVGRFLSSLAPQTDVVLQIGALFNARWYDTVPPSIIYTDYTTKLEFDRRHAGRSPFTAKTLQSWLQLEQQTYARAAYICTRSDLVKQSIVQDYNIPSEKISVIGGGPNFLKLPDLTQKTPSKKPTALFIGQNFYRKGGDLVLQAFAKARDVIPEAQLLFLSQGPIPQNMPLTGVQLVSPVWDREMVANLYRQADVFILPSRLETWGDVILEAMAYGIPCIGVLGEPMQEIIEPGVTGLLAPPENVDALAGALIQLLGNKELRLQFGLIARQRVEQRFTWTHTVDLLADVINQVSKEMTSV